MPVPKHLLINGRKEDQSFSNKDRLYRSFSYDEYEPIQNTIQTRTIKFPDFSCNWDRYSFPIDVRYRLNGSDKDGCFSFTVGISRFNNCATPVHNPIDNPEFPNYSHTEVRALRDSEGTNYLPPRKRKLSKGKKLAYRESIANNLKIEIMPRD